MYKVLYLVASVHSPPSSRAFKMCQWENNKLRRPKFAPQSFTVLILETLLCSSCNSSCVCSLMQMCQTFARVRSHHLLFWLCHRERESIAAAVRKENMKHTLAQTCSLWHTHAVDFSLCLCMRECVYVFFVKL